MDVLLFLLIGFQDSSSYARVGGQVKLDDCQIYRDLS